MDTKIGFFLNVGVTKSQINLIWMEFIEIILIYIYLDYYSYSIYQEENTIGKLSGRKDKINYFNLYYNNETRKVSQKLTPKEYEGHIQCMKYNFDVDITKSYSEFIDFMKKDDKDLKKKLKNSQIKSE